MKIINTDTTLSVTFKELAELLGVSPAARIYMIESSDDDHGDSTLPENTLRVSTTTEEHD